MGQGGQRGIALSRRRDRRSYRGHRSCRSHRNRRSRRAAGAGLLRPESTVHRRPQAAVLRTKQVRMTPADMPLEQTRYRPAQLQDEPQTDSVRPDAKHRTHHQRRRPEVRKRASAAGRCALAANSGETASAGAATAAAGAGATATAGSLAEAPPTRA